MSFWHPLSTSRRSPFSILRALSVLAWGVLSAGPQTRADDVRIATLKGIVRAVNAGDAKIYARAYAPGAAITIYGGETLNGREAIEQYEVELLKQFPRTTLAFEEIWEAGPVAVVHYAVNGETPSGQRMGHEGLLFYRFDSSGFITEEHRYLDSLTPMAQLGAFAKTPLRPPPILQTTVAVYEKTNSDEETLNEKTVATCLANMSRKREAATLAIFDEHAEVDELMFLEPFAGKQGAKAWLEIWTRAADARMKVTGLVAAGHFVLVETTVKGTLKGALGPIKALSSGRNFEVHRAWIFELKSGSIVRVAAFLNGKELAQSIRQWPLAAMPIH